MTTPTRRHPLPALIFLLALCLLTALVWWRVINRDGPESSAAQRCPTTAATGASGLLPNPVSVTVLVLNSTDRSGIAAGARTALLAAGFRIPDPARNDAQEFGGTGNPVPETAEIRYGSAAEPAAHLLAYYLPGAKLVQTDKQGSTVIVSLGEKFDKVADNETVRAKLATDKLSLAPAPAATDATSGGTGTGSGTSTPPC